MEYKVNNISYKYAPDGKEVLKNVSFSIEKGKVTAIVGPSGCGKSTLVEIFSGVIPKLISGGVLEGSFDMPENTFVLSLIHISCSTWVWTASKRISGKESR